eukprot:TRINITY_DN3241_c0_g1_i1.p1 TRINITY_DN3241_c0_g1~~TRINITY_DN3241_c0_g1_i1.p1  ORF type:complete len:1273 (+),score=358.79 TRINITY_DN3241_c0_g1_i1:212-3820(+)
MDAADGTATPRGAGQTSVTVAVRCRPLPRYEEQDPARLALRMVNQTVVVRQSPKHPQQHSFTFDKAFWSVPSHVSPNPYATQEKVYNEIGRHVLEDALKGYNCCILAYGQTGSGKSYSMFGGDDPEPASAHREERGGRRSASAASGARGALPRGVRDSSARSRSSGAGAVGLVPRIVRELYDHIASRPDFAFRVEISFYQIYLERVTCLLNNQHGVLKVREHPLTGPYVEDLTSCLCHDRRSMMKIIAEGAKARKVAFTRQNACSSRSHAVISVTLTQQSRSDASMPATVSRMSLVDLAGSERVSRSGSVGQGVLEATTINQSLSILGKVISILSSKLYKRSGGKSVHVPYRDSVLTWLLRESLGGNSRTVMLATVSSSMSDREESLATLRYAEQAKRIVNKAVVNESSNTQIVGELQREIKFLQEQLYVGADQVLQEKLVQSRKLMEQMSKTWDDKWTSTQQLLREREVQATKWQQEKQTMSQQIKHLEKELCRAKREQAEMVQLRRDFEKLERELHERGDDERHFAGRTSSLSSITTVTRMSSRSGSTTPPVSPQRARHVHSAPSTPTRGGGPAVRGRSRDQLTAVAPNRAARGGTPTPTVHRIIRPNAARTAKQRSASETGSVSTPTRPTSATARFRTSPLRGLEPSELSTPDRTAPRQHLTSPTSRPTGGLRDNSPGPRGPPIAPSPTTSQGIVSHAPQHAVKSPPHIVNRSSGSAHRAKPAGPAGHGRERGPVRRMEYGEAEEAADPALGRQGVSDDDSDTDSSTHHDSDEAESSSQSPWLPMRDNAPRAQQPRSRGAAAAAAAAPSSSAPHRAAHDRSLHARTVLSATGSALRIASAPGDDITSTITSDSEVMSDLSGRYAQRAQRLQRPGGTGTAPQGRPPHTGVTIPLLNTRLVRQEGPAAAPRAGETREVVGRGGVRVKLSPRPVITGKHCFFDQPRPGTAPPVQAGAESGKAAPRDNASREREPSRNKAPDEDRWKRWLETKRATTGAAAPRAASSDATAAAPPAPDASATRGRPATDERRGGDYAPTSFRRPSPAAVRDRTQDRTQGQEHGQASGAARPASAARAPAAPARPVEAPMHADPMHADPYVSSRASDSASDGEGPPSEDSDPSDGEEASEDSVSTDRRSIARETEANTRNAIANSEMARKRIDDDYQRQKLGLAPLRRVDAPRARGPLRSVSFAAAPPQCIASE